MIFWLLLGIVIGYLFKPQIDDAIKRVARLIKEAGNGGSGDSGGGTTG